MKKVYILIIFANISVLVAASILLVSCTAGNSNDSIPNYALSSQIQEKTPEEEAREQKYSEELKKANEEINSYKYLYGDSDYYETTLAMNTAGSKVPVFLNPEKALEQSFKDYKDAYDYVSREFYLSRPKKGDLDGIREYANMCYQAHIEDDARLSLRCSNLGRLLYAYRSSYMKAES